MNTPKSHTKEYLIIGTLGHIDHGKTSLIEALNGFWGDSQKEEQRRGITLDLSFSNLNENGVNIAFIDVPGHEKLIKNMIAGAFGIDYALLVIACNEGIMPQTYEHLRIACVLGICDFIVVLSKSDLATKSQIQTLKNQITKLFETLNSSTRTLKYCFFECSIKESSTILPLKSHLLSLSKKHFNDLGFFRYYIDRVFVIKGAGCVVSGTILSGNIKTNDKVWCCPLERQLGIKNIQTHNHTTQSATCSQRVALNLSGVSHTELKRGDLLTQKGYLRGFDTLEVALELFGEIEHNSLLQFFIGAVATSCRILFLDNTKKYATIKTKIPIYAIFGERFILRNEKETLGGGRVLNPIADPMKKSQKLQLLECLSEQDFKKAFKILLSAHKKGFGLISATQRFALSQKNALSIAQTLKNCFVDEKSLVVYPNSSVLLVENLINDIITKNPNALLSASLLAQKQSWISEDFATFVLAKLLKAKKLLQKESFFISPKFNAHNIYEYLCDRVYSLLKEQNFQPLAPYNLYDVLDIDKKLGDEIYKQLTQDKKIIRLNHKLFITAYSLSKLLELMRDIIAKEGYLDINNFKNHLNLSRKYLIAYLEYLDSFSDIINNHDKRYFKNNPQGLK